MFFVYILYSPSLTKFYVGHTQEVQKRIGQHNAGKGNFTSTGIPWTLVTQIECLTKSEAMLLELKIKKRGIRRYLSDNGISL
ncbi:MAG: GIY-YIG nuclease family protein, partial [Chitinophagaceae bacterium]